jgi:hypothetical protein
MRPGFKSLTGLLAILGIGDPAIVPSMIAANHHSLLAHPSALLATTRPAAVHHATDIYITTYTAIDPLRSHGATVVLDGFFGWPLTANAS